MSTKETVECYICKKQLVKFPSTTINEYVIVDGKICCKKHPGIEKLCMEEVKREV